MFDTNMIARKIKQARIDKNMTQMNLADAMGVSYQAVSNWERGNSMPDIAKLGDLCQVLGLSVNELLGMEEPAAKAAAKAMEQQEMTIEELAEVAPMLKPSEVKEQVKARKKKLDLARIANLAPHLDEASLSEIVLEAAEDSLEGIDEIACYLDTKTLEQIVERAKPEDMSELIEIACYLSKKALERLVERILDEDLGEISEIACYLDSSALEKLVRRYEAAGKTDEVEEISCYLSEEALEGIVDRVIAGDAFYEDLSELYCYMGDRALKKLAKHLMGKRDLDALEDLMPFV